MDPATAALLLANTIAQIVLLRLQHFSEEDWKQLNALDIAQLQQWIAFVNGTVKKNTTA